MEFKELNYEIFQNKKATFVWGLKNDIFTLKLLKLIKKERRFVYESIYNDSRIA